MGIIKEPKATNFKIILRDEAYSIPDLQRDYDWKKKECVKFWQDIELIFDNDISEYFLGPMVFVEYKDNDGNQIKPTEIIDGQQRIITTTILAAAIRDILEGVTVVNNPTKIANTIFMINQLLFTNTNAGSYGTIPRVNPSSINESFYKDYIIKKGNIQDKLDLAPEENSNKKIFDTYKFLVEKINKKWDDDSEKEKNLPDFIQLITKSFLTIVIRVDSIENGHKVFETLNYRGKDLSVSSLVKNFLLEKSGQLTSDTVRKWKKMVENLGNISQDTFLQHYWVAHHEQVTPSNLFDKIKEKTDSSDKVQELLDKLVDNSVIYKQIKEPDKNYWFNEEDIEKYLEELETLGNDSAQPVILNAKIHWNDKSKIKNIIEACSKIHFRAKTVGTKKPNELVKVFSDIAENIRTNSNYDDSQVIQDLSKLDSPPEVFATNFKDHKFAGKTASYVLKKIESSRNGVFTVTQISHNAQLEHILPQKPDPGWDINFHIVKDEKYISKIGNMTLLHKKLNGGAQNEVFQKKIPYYIQQKGNLKILDELLSYSDWTKKNIDDRTDKFVNDAAKIWTL